MAGFIVDVLYRPDEIRGGKSFSSLLFGNTSPLTNPQRSIPSKRGCNSFPCSQVSIRIIAQIRLYANHFNAAIRCKPVYTCTEQTSTHIPYFIAASASKAICVSHEGVSVEVSGIMLTQTTRPSLSRPSAKTRRTDLPKA